MRPLPRRAWSRSALTHSEQAALIISGDADLRTFGSYAWLYLGSFGMGLGAFLISMTFRPFPKDQSVLAGA